MGGCWLVGWIPVQGMGPDDDSGFLSLKGSVLLLSIGTLCGPLLLNL